MKNNLVDALRLVLPFAVERADKLRNVAKDFPGLFGDKADAATHAVTAARLALADADEMKCEARYRVRFNHARTASQGSTAATPHVFDVMADCAECAEKKAREMCEAVGLVIGAQVEVTRV